MIQIIPAIDLIDGKCVRLSQGDYNKKIIYRSSPLEVAKEFEDVGIKRLHLVDLDGAKAKHIVNWKVLEQIAGHTHLVIDFGGGLKSNEDLEIAFKSGAAMVTGGSIAVNDRATFEGWLQEYGGEKIILGADVKEEKIAVSGWLEDTDLNIFDFIDGYVHQGITQVISTDIAVDGMLTGPSCELYEKLQQRFPDLHIIASGGISKLQDIIELGAMNLQSVIVGKAIYEGRITLKDIENFYK